MVMLCVPVGAMREAGEAIAADLADGVVVSDVGSVKGSILDDLRAVLPPGVAIVPGHPVAGTENSGPDAGFAQLFHNRWCILTPDERTEAFRSEEHTSELQSLMRISYAVFCLKKKHRPKDRTTVD